MANNSEGGMANRFATMLLRIEQGSGMAPASRANLYVEGQHFDGESIEEFEARKPVIKIVGEIA